MTIILRIISYIIYIPFWHVLRAFPRNPNLWVFGAWFGEKYTDNAKDLFEFVTVNDKTIDAVWITRNKDIYDKLNQQDIKCYLNNSFKGIFTCIRAKLFVFSSAKYDINPLLMNGATKIQTWHGAPMKKIGLDNIFLKYKNKQKLIKLLFPFLYEFNYDYVVSSSEFFDTFLCSAFDVKKNQVITSGYPRNDVFFKSTKSKYLTFLHSKFKKPKIIFYLPTFRDNEPDIDLFFKFDFDLNLWERYLEETNTLLVLKPHYGAKYFINKLKSERIIYINDDQESDLNLFMKDVDVLITDYSGAYFDFKLTTKPIILAPFDLEEYISFSRELYIEYESLEELKGENWNEILMILKQDKFLKSLNIKTKFNDYYDGKSSERLLKSIKQKVLN